MQTESHIGTKLDSIYKDILILHFCYDRGTINHNCRIGNEKRGTVSDFSATFCTLGLIIDLEEKVETVVVASEVVKAIIVK